LGFGIEVIDETALLDSIPKKNNAKQSRRASKKIHKKTVTTVTQPETGGVRNISSSSSETEMKNKKKYSRDEM
ncbi:putative spliceosome-like protein, partial [Trifolium medium]|nr:putative spliceosome-like protein [Trifolium medium]